MLREVVVGDSRFTQPWNSVDQRTKVSDRNGISSCTDAHSHSKAEEAVFFQPPPLSQKEEEIAALRHQVETVQAEYDDLLKSHQGQRKQIKNLRQKCHLARELLQRKDLEIESIREKAKRAESRARGELVLGGANLATSSALSAPSSSSSSMSSSTVEADTTLGKASSTSTFSAAGKGEKSGIASVMHTSLTPAETVSPVAC